MTIWSNFKRTARAGFIGFWRNGFVSLASVLIMTVTLFVFGSTIFINALLEASIHEVESRVDINVYFSSSAKEDDILALKTKVETLPEVALPVEYISKEDVLGNFKKHHENDEVILQSLDELDVNPFGAILNIRAKEVAQYEGIARFFADTQTDDGGTQIQKINYYNNKQAIDSLGRAVDGGRKIGASITIALALLSILITFNTIRLSTYIARDEIAVMRLVGASNGFIREPFIIAGAMYGALAGIIVLGGFYPVTYWIASSIGDFFGGLDLFAYYIEHFGEITLLLVISGIVLGSVSSFLAVRRYLRI
jgi:cell division transport system permease protein